MLLACGRGVWAKLLPVNGPAQLVPDGRGPKRAIYLTAIRGQRMISINEQFSGNRL